MQTLIQSHLKQIEEKNKIKVLFACETGSRAWGFPSPDSDYDVRMVYMHEPDWYLSLTERKDSFEYMSPDGELDITGWDVRKSLRLLMKSNGALLERIQSPIVYRQEPNVIALYAKHAEKCFSPIATLYHYLGMAKTSFADMDGQKEIKLKKIFYALRATLACKWIFDKDSIPPIVFSTMVDELAFPIALKVRIAELVLLKAGVKESYMHPAEADITEFIRNQIQFADANAQNLSGTKDKDVDMDGFFRTVLKGYWP